MATELARQDYTNLKSSSFTIPLAHHPAAGNTIIFTAAGGAISTPVGFLRLGVYGNGNQDCSVWWKTATGTETSLTINNNGSGDNTGGCVLQYAETLTPIASTNNGHGAIPDQSSDFQITAPELDVTGAALLIVVWSATQSTAYNDGNRFRQLGPVGELVSSGHNQPGNGGTDIIFAVGVADLDATHSYPANAAAGAYDATTTYQLGATCFSTAATFADTSGVPSVAVSANPVVRENTLPGTNIDNWYLNTDGMDDTIAGFPTALSFQAGDTATFKVDSSGHTFRGRIYRHGWYSDDGFSARHVLGNQAGYLVGTVVTQPTPVVDSTLGSTSCAAWSENLSWDIPDDAATGLYSIIFERTDTGGHLATSHFVIREATVTDKITVIIPDITSHMYNRWGSTGDSVATGFTGRSVYGDATDRAHFAGRAYGVCFDRPYATQSDDPVTYLYDALFGWLVFAEMMGYELTYLSDTDLIADPTLLSDAAMVAVIGHHEYWPAEVFTAIQNARDVRVNVFFYTANTAGWRTREYTADTTGRTVACYKDSGTRDVSPGFAGTGYDPVFPTGTWRDPNSTNGVPNPDLRRENALTGQQFVASGPVLTPLVITDDRKTLPIFRASDAIQDLDPGESLTDISNSGGYEIDSSNGATGQPANLAILLATDIAVTTGANAAGSVYSTATTVTATWSLYRADSGALVANIGWRGLWSATRWQGASRVSTTSLDIQAAFAALMYDLGAVAQTPTNVLVPGTDTPVPDVSIGAPGTGDPSGNDLVAAAYGLTIPSAQTGAVALSSEPTFGASGVARVSAAAALSSTPALSATAIRRVPGAVALSATPALTASATDVVSGAVALSTTPVLTGTAAATSTGAATLSATPTLSGTGVDVVSGAVALGTTPALAAAAIDTEFAAATLSATPALTAAAVATAAAAVALTALPTLSASGTGGTQGAAVTLSATPALSATGREQAVAAVALNTEPSLTATAIDVRLGTVVLAAEPILSASAVRVQLGAAILSTTPILTASAARAPLGAVALVLTSTLSSAASVIRVTAAALASEPVVSATGTDATAHGAVALSTTPTLAALAAANYAAHALLESVPGFGGTAGRDQLAAVVLAATPLLRSSADSGSGAALELVTESTLSGTAGAGPAAFVLLVAEPTLVISTAVTITRARLAFAWQLAPPRWRFAVLTGIRRLYYDRDSVDYVQLNSGVPPDVNAQADVVEFAFTSADDRSARPSTPDWHTGEWFVSATKLIARVLIGPGVIPLAPDTYQVWVRVTDNPERPVQRAGAITIT